jgi:hypothetical protein
MRVHLEYFNPILILLLSACASPPTKVAIQNALPDGVWEGEVNKITKSDGKETILGKKLVWLAACGGEARVWLGDENGRFETPRVPFRVESSNGIHLLSFVDSSNPNNPSWEESQTWSVTELDKQQVQVKWNRVVNNFGDLSHDHAKRTFQQEAFGILKRTSNVCVPEKVNP